MGEQVEVSVDGMQLLKKMMKKTTRKRRKAMKPETEITTAMPPATALWTKVIFPPPSRRRKCHQNIQIGARITIRVEKRLRHQVAEHLLQGLGLHCLRESPRPL